MEKPVKIQLIYMVILHLVKASLSIQQNGNTVPSQATNPPPHPAPFFQFSFTVITSI